MLPQCVIVEDEVMFAEMLRSMLHSVRGLEVAATVHSVKEGLNACLAHRPSLLILDLDLPDGDGLMVAKFLARCAPEGRVIILSASAATFVAPAELSPRIHAVIDKTRTYASLQREVLALLQNHLAPGTTPRDPKDTLSPREWQVFRLLGRGLMSKEIAAELEIAVTTVSLHRKRIASKLKCYGSELMRFAALHASVHMEPTTEKKSGGS